MPLLFPYDINRFSYDVARIEGIVSLIAVFFFFFFFSNAFFNLSIHEYIMFSIERQWYTTFCTAAQIGNQRDISLGYRYIHRLTSLY